MRDPLGDDQKQRILARIASEPVRRSSIPWRVAIPVAATASLALVAWLVIPTWRSGSVSDQSLASSGPMAGDSRTTLLTDEGRNERLDHVLSDGSVVELTPGAVVEVLEQGASAVRLKVHRGSATFEVRHDGPRPWTVVAGNVLIEVTGTRFQVDRIPGRVSVEVIRGRVRITQGTGGGERHDVSAGEVAVVTEGEPIVVALVTGPDVPRMELPPEVPSPASSPDDPAVAGSGEAGSRDGGRHEHHEVSAHLEPDATSAVSTWQDLARQREYREGYEMLGADGLAAESARVENMEELLLLADLARLSGHPRDAVRPLERAMSEFPGDRRAASAAFSLGRVQLVLGNSPGAVVAFERCLALNPPRILREDAFARLAQARAASGDAAGARQAAEEYLRLYPDGRRAEAMRQLASPSP
jgi:transmembrane sensor